MTSNELVKNFFYAPSLTMNTCMLLRELAIYLILNWSFLDALFLNR